MNKKIEAALREGTQFVQANVPNWDDLNPNPILQSWVSAFPQDELDAASEVLAPTVPVTGEKFEFPEYSVYSVIDDVETVIANDGGYNVIDKTAPNWQTGRTVRHGLAIKVTDPATLGLHKTPWDNTTACAALLRLHLQRRRLQAIKALMLAKASVPGQYTAASVKWDATSGTIDPRKDIDVVDEQIYTLFGERPNTMVLTYLQARALARWVEDKKIYTGVTYDGSLPTKFHNKDIVIVDAKKNTANPGAAVSLGRIFSEDNAYLMYLNPAYGGTAEAITALATYRNQAYGADFRAVVLNAGDYKMGATGQYVALDTHYAIAEVAGTAIGVITDTLT